MRPSDAATADGSEHVGHLLAAAVFVVATLLAVGVFEHVQQRRRATQDRIPEGRPATDPLLRIVAGSGAAAAAIHFAVAPSHWNQHLSYGVFFLLAATGQLGYAVVMLNQLRRAHLAGYIAGNIAILLLWLCSRTVGVPVGPAAWEREPVGVLDVLAGAFELVLVAAGTVALLSAGRSASRTRFPRRFRRQHAGRRAPA